MIRERWTDAEHMIRLSDDDGRSVEVWHPQTCEQGQYREGCARDYDCGLAHHLSEWGLDLHLKDVPDGLYLAEYWFLPGGWAGPVALDPEDGIDLTTLTPEEFTA